MEYASKSEACYARYLDTLLKAGKIRAWEGQVNVVLIVEGAKICRMVPDFLVTHKNGKCEYVEVKGMVTAVYKLKAKLFKALYPDAWYTVVPAKKALAL